MDLPTRVRHSLENVTAATIALLCTASLAAPYPEDTPEGLFKFAFSVFEEFQLTQRIDGPIDESEIVKSFGEPVERRDRKEWSREPGVMNRLRTLAYEGLEITIATPLIGQTPASWLKRIKVTSPHYRLAGGLRIGQSLQLFVEKLNLSSALPPTRDFHKKRRLEFYAGGYEAVDGVAFAGHATITLTVNDEGKVEAVDWWYWAD